MQLKKDVKTTTRKYLILLLVLSLTVTLLTPVFAEEAEPEDAAQQTETAEQETPAEDAHVSSVEDDAVSRAIRDYVTSLGGVHPTPYVKGGMAMAWGCCAFVNLVWLRVFGKDTYDAKPESVESGGAVSDVASWLTANGAKNGDIVWAHNGVMTHYIIIHDWDENGMWISDGCMAGIVSHNYEYVSYNYYPGFFSGACALTLYRLPDDMRAKVEPEIPEDFEEDTWSSEPILTAMGQGIMQTNDDGKFLDEIRRARTQADVVIALPHWGTEHSTVQLVFCSNGPD